MGFLCCRLFVCSGLLLFVYLIVAFLFGICIGCDCMDCDG